MKYFNELTNVETEVIRLSEMKNLFSIILNGTETSSREEIISALHYIEGSLSDISECLSKEFLVLFNTIRRE